MAFVDRENELDALEQFWRSGTAQFVPVVGRRRVGKTTLLEHFADRKGNVVYYRCQLLPTSAQLPLLGVTLAELSGDEVLRAQAPATWPAVFALIERLTQRRRLLLILDEIPYWVARDESLPSLLQNWWDSEGRKLDIMVVLCGSAVQMMERLLTGEAPLAGCVTRRMRVSPLNFRAAADLLRFRDPISFPHRIRDSGRRPSLPDLLPTRSQHQGEHPGGYRISHGPPLRGAAGRFRVLPPCLLYTSPSPRD